MIALAGHSLSFLIEQQGCFDALVGREFRTPWQVVLMTKLVPFHPNISTATKLILESSAVNLEIIALADLEKGWNYKGNL